MQVDCHIHSLYSDGIYTVKEIVEMLLQRNIQVFSLTDHDTVEGTKEARESGKNKIRFISGIEFTCKEMRISTIGKVFSIHLLGYNFDENNLQLCTALNKRKERVIYVYENLCAELTALGYSVLREEIPISCGNALQLCDVATYIQKKYLDVSENILKVIDNCAVKLNNANISVEEAVKLIHDAGGKAVWAHPFCVYKDFKKISIDEKEILDTLDVLSRIDVDGIEAYYLAFDDKKQKWLRAAAESRDMIYTAGSDFHGSIGRDCMGIEISEFF